MKNIYDFLTKTGELKGIPRRGWVLRKIDNPESIAEHIFRATVMGWVLGKRNKELNTEILLKGALVHDLCEVYAGDTTPYDSILPDNEEEIKEMVKTWPRFSLEKKKNNFEDKHKKEKEALKKLTANLPDDLKNEIESYWMDYEKRLSPEGMFFNQADRMESFLQVYEYKEKYKDLSLASWWIQAREFVDDPVLFEFMNLLELKFHKHEVPDELKFPLEVVNFISEIGDLKRMQRSIWVNKVVEDVETIAEHIYHLTLLVWIFGRNRNDLDLEKMMKMSLVSDMCEIRSSAKDKEEAMRLLLEDLDENTRKEIFEPWDEYYKGASSESVFVKQAKEVTNLIQAVEYSKTNENIDGLLWVNKTRGVVVDENLNRLVDEIEKEISSKQNSA